MIGEENPILSSAMSKDHLEKSLLVKCLLSHFEADNAGVGDVGADGGVSSTSELSNSVALLATVTAETVVCFTYMSVIFLLLIFLSHSSSFNIIFRL